MLDMFLTFVLGSWSLKTVPVERDPDTLSFKSSLNFCKRVKR